MNRFSAIPAKKKDEPRNVVTEGSLGESRVRGNAPQGKKGVADRFSLQEFFKSGAITTCSNDKLLIGWESIS